MITIGSRMKHYRKKAGLTQEQVAAKLNVKPSNYAKYESGERNPKDDRIFEISKILGVSYDALLTGVEREFADLLHRYTVVVLTDNADSFVPFYSDVIENDAFRDGISGFFAMWDDVFEAAAKSFHEKFLASPSLESLIELRDLHLVYLNAIINNEIAPASEIELESDPELEDEVVYRLAFCIAMTKYLSQESVARIILEADNIMKGNDITPLQFFAIKVFIPFLSHIIEGVEMTMWNSTIDDFEIYFLHGALTAPDSEEFDDDNGDNGDE